MKSAYLFSVVMPLYNTKSTLAEAIDSIIDQSIGFKKNIQIILVNDGSTDDTENICIRYRTKYPENIEYLKKKNGGVSSARNLGIKHIRGEYTVFLDGDDKWSKDSFKAVYSFFNKNNDAIDICACRIKYIGDFKDKIHPLDFKYEHGNQIIDLYINPEYINPIIGNVVIKSIALREESFDTLLRYCEDSLFCNSIILKKMKVGIVPSAVFYYRKNNNASSLSKGIEYTKEWYLEIPERYYLGIFDASKSKKGSIVSYIQYVVCYDIQWRRYIPTMMNTLNEHEKEAYVDFLSMVLRSIEDNVIANSKGMNQYKRLYLFDLKYKKNIISDSIIENVIVRYNNQDVLNIRSKSMFDIKSIDIIDKMITFQGITRIGCISDDVKLFAMDGGNNKYSVGLEDYPKGNVHGFIGEILAKGKKFKVSMPVRYNTRINFFAYIDGEEIELSPGFGKSTGIDRHSKRGYCIIDDYLIKHIGRGIYIYKNKNKTLLMSELRYCNDLARRNGIKSVIEHMHDLRMYRIAARARIKKQVAFVSVRAGRLLDNMDIVYNGLDCKKVVYAKMKPHDKKDEISFVKAIYQSKVVITDDYMYFFQKYGKRKGQYFIQLWHAAGAFKKFGIDGTSMFPSTDSETHRDYDLVTVSSEYIMKYYSHAFSIDPAKVRALGCARTDLLFNEERNELIAAGIYEKYRRLKGKQIILYAPTFRDIVGVKRNKFMPELDFDLLSQSLNDNQVFAICPHPVMTEKILKKKYNNIIEMRDFSTNEMMIVSDVLITDYSSVIFEYALLNKPIAFYCYDFDTYDRDFYIDYPDDLPGEVFRTQEEIIGYLIKAKFAVSDKQNKFKEKYMEACDGHSCERIIREINNYLQK